MGGLIAGQSSTTGVAEATPARAAAAILWPPDPWLYCYRTAINGLYWGWRVEYAGINSNPSYNSPRTNCRDRWSGEGFWWYSARRVDWNTACRMTYGSNSSSWVFAGNGLVYCRR